LSSSRSASSVGYPDGEQVKEYPDDEKCDQYAQVSLLSMENKSSEERSSCDAAYPSNRELSHVCLCFQKLVFANSPKMRLAAMS
jgi:hypothetical protein